MLEGKCENGVPKVLSSHHRKIINEQKQENAEKRTKKEKWRIKETMMKKKKKRWTKGQRKMIFRVIIKNDPWSNHPKTQFEPIYPFFRNHKPWPILRTWKVHFDQSVDTWTEELFPWGNFFVINKGCCLLSSAKILDKPFTCSGWIFKCIIRQSKQKKKKRKKEMKWKRKRKNDSRVKTRERAV